MLLHLIGRVRRLVARLDAHAVLPFGKRRGVPLELGLREDIVGLQRVTPLRLAFALEGDAVAERVAVGVVDLPRDLHDALVLADLTAARRDAVAGSFAGAALRGRADLGDDGAHVVGDERDVTSLRIAFGSRAQRARTCT